MIVTLQSISKIHCAVSLSLTLIFFSFFLVILLPGYFRILTVFLSFLFDEIFTDLRLLKLFISHFFLHLLLELICWNFNYFSFFWWEKEREKDVIKNPWNDFRSLKSSQACKYEMEKSGWFQISFFNFSRWHRGRFFLFMSVVKNEIKWYRKALEFKF